jgi:hypothetical protein
MRALIIYESMYGNTHLVAEAIAGGLQRGNDVIVIDWCFAFGCWPATLPHPLAMLRPASGARDRSARALAQPAITNTPRC